MTRRISLLLVGLYYFLIVFSGFCLGVACAKYGVC